MERRWKRHARSKGRSGREKTVRKERMKEERQERRTERSMSDTETIWCLQASTVPADCLISHNAHTHTHLHTSRHEFNAIHTHINTRTTAYLIVLCVFMHLVAVPNKAGRLTDHIASNQKSDRESDRERERVR